MSETISITTPGEVCHAEEKNDEEPLVAKPVIYYERNSC
jgi:hypothetical protein